MAKKAVQANDSTRVTVRFRNAAVAEEFHRQAAEANKRPSPFAAELIEQALTAGDAIEFEQDTVRREFKELRDLLETFRGLPQELPESLTNNDDMLAELSALREEIGGIKETLAVAEDLSDNLRKLLREFKKLQANVTELAALPRVFVKLREDIATGVHPLLVRSGLTRQEAADWIRRTLLEE
jgi:chromosome segregation ATPase